MPRTNLLTGLLIAACLAGAGACADVVHLVGGTLLEGQVETELETQVILRLLNGGKVVLAAERIVAIDREPPEMFFVRKGDWLADKGQEREAEAAYREAIALAPASQEARDRLAAMLLARTIVRVNQMIQQAEALMVQRKYREAIRAYSAARDESPSDELTHDLNRRMAIAYARLAYLYFDHCYDQGARIELEKAKDVNPNCAEIYYVLGRIFHDDGDLVQAQTNYEQALNLDPTHVPARSQLMALQNELNRATTMVQ